MSYRRSACAFLMTAFLGLLASDAGAGVNFTGNGANTGLPAGVFAFEDAGNWDAAVPELEPPGGDSVWFAENIAGDATLILTDERSGENGTLPMGGFSFGGDSATDDNANFTLVLRNSVTLTGQEWTVDENDQPILRGDPPGSFRRISRIGRENSNPPAPLSGATTDDFSWGILKHEAGTLRYHVDMPEDNQGLDFSRDKENSAGAIYEISGDAILDLGGPIRTSRGESTSGRTTPGIIFRVVGSDATVNVGSFQSNSKLGLWDHDNPTEPGFAPNARINLGKMVTEFVLDSEGVSPINVAGNLSIGSYDTRDAAVELAYGFLRLKISEPLEDGGAAEDVVLFRSDTISSDLDDLVDPMVVEDARGRFTDPDRTGTNSGGLTTAHDTLLDGDTAIASYAGAEYHWTINYNHTPDDEGTVEDSVFLTGLTIVGTPGDLDGSGDVDASDRSALEAAIAAPPTIRLGDPQHLFDLNADEVVDAADLTAFDLFFGDGEVGLVGDSNGDGVINTLDIDAFVLALTDPSGYATQFPDVNFLANNDINGDDAVSTLDIDPFVALLTGGVGSVPEPSTALLVVLLQCGWAACRPTRRS